MPAPESISGSDMGTEMIARSISGAEGRQGNEGGTLSATPAWASSGIPYKNLKATHPSYDAAYWSRLRALYKGGRALLGNRALMTEIFPRHREEIGAVYEERVKRAFYIPYTAEILDHIVAGLAAEPIAMALGSDEQGGQADLPPFYQDFIKDVSHQGGQRQELNEMIREQIRNALLLMTAWTLIELPRVIDETGQPRQFGSEGEQEKAGALDAYAVVVDPESVIDWEEDDSGELDWAIIRTVTARRAFPAVRDTVTQTWMLYTRTEWVRFEVRHKHDQEPKDDTIIPVVAHGAHGFGRVPLVRLQVPDGLWAMNKMEGLARELFNKRAALAWGEIQTLLPDLYEFLGPEMGTRGTPIGEAQEDPGRATSLPRGQGFVQVRGSEDRAEFVGPDSAPFTEVRASCEGLRDELHRVMHQMALSLDNSASSVGRSADSKAQDKAAVAVILTELGKLARKHAEDVLAMVARGRQEMDLVDQWSAQGMATFDAVAVGDAIEQALSIDQLHVPSPTFQKRHYSTLCRAILGDDATDEDLDQIDSELEENITAESLMPPPPPEAGLPPPGRLLKPGKPPRKPGTTRAYPVPKEE